MANSASRSFGATMRTGLCITCGVIVTTSIEKARKVVNIYNTVTWSSLYFGCLKMRVFHLNESCLLALSLLHNSREDGDKQGSSHFDEKDLFDRTLQYHFTAMPIAPANFFDVLIKICLPSKFVNVYDSRMKMYSCTHLSQSHATAGNTPLARRADLWFAKGVL